MVWTAMVVGQGKRIVSDQYLQGSFQFVSCASHLVVIICKRVVLSRVEARLVGEWVWRADGIGLADGHAYCIQACLLDIVA